MCAHMYMSNLRLTSYSELSAMQNNKLLWHSGTLGGVFITFPIHPFMILEISTGIPMGAQKVLCWWWSIGVSEHGVEGSLEIV